MRIDLHMHSTHSDGKMSPSEVVCEAERLGVSVLAITDHDEISGFREAEKAAANKQIKLLSGIEFNTDGKQGELHILGYGLDVEHPKLLKYVKWRKEERLEWSQRIVSQLKELGYEIEWENCWKRASGQVIVRTHIADELVANGYFSSSKHAYETLLKKGRKAFINREGLSAEEAIELIHECGGKSFLAHPGIYDWEFSLSDLLEAGLNGIEVYYSQHNDHDTNKWLELAKRNQLLVSVGSDFHGYQSRSPYPIGSVDYNEKQLEWVFAQLEEEVRK